MNGGQIMNTPSTLTISTSIQRKQEAERSRSLLNSIFEVPARIRMALADQAGMPIASQAPVYRASEPVRHSRFGMGRVVSAWPDGRLLVRFDSLEKNQLVFPSFLKRVN
jgi:hypothetical protein